MRTTCGALRGANPSGTCQAEDRISRRFQGGNPSLSVRMNLLRCRGGRRHSPANLGASPLGGLSGLGGDLRRWLNRHRGCTRGFRCNRGPRRGRRGLSGLKLCGHRCGVLSARALLLARCHSELTSQQACSGLGVEMGSSSSWLRLSLLSLVAVFSSPSWRVGGATTVFPAPTLPGPVADLPESRRRVR